MTNFYPGLAKGPIDHQSSSIINSTSNGPITMGSSVLVTVPGGEELLARVTESPAISVLIKLYGIAVGGDVDGIYGDGDEAFTDLNRATNDQGQGVEIVTQGRCLARVESTVAIAIGDPLGSSGGGVGNEGVLVNQLTEPTSPILARALQELPASPGFHIIAVDVQREGAGGGVAEPNLQAFFIPQIDTSNSSTTTYEITRGLFPSSSVNSMPWAGTIKRIMVGHNSTIGDGFVQVIRFPNGVGPGVPLAQVNYTGTAGIFTEKIVYDESFLKGDGLAISFLGDGITSSTLTITLEVEFDFV